MYGLGTPGILSGVSGVIPGVDLSPVDEFTGVAACRPLADPRRRVAIVLDHEVIFSRQLFESGGTTSGRTENLHL